MKTTDQKGLYEVLRENNRKRDSAELPLHLRYNSSPIIRITAGMFYSHDQMAGPLCTTIHTADASAFESSHGALRTREAKQLYAMLSTYANPKTITFTLANYVRKNLGESTRESEFFLAPIDFTLSQKRIKFRYKTKAHQCKHPLPDSAVPCLDKLGLGYTKDQKGIILSKNQQRDMPTTAELLEAHYALEFTGMNAGFKSKSRKSNLTIGPGPRGLAYQIVLCDPNKDEIDTLSSILSKEFDVQFDAGWEAAGWSDSDNL